MKITQSLVDRIRTLVGYGLSHGLGERGRGTMCIQACINAAIEDEHGDQPKCVPQARTNFGIALNDALGWSSDQARGEGLRDYAIAQLGTSRRAANQFNKEVAWRFCREFLPEGKKVTSFAEAEPILRSACLLTHPSRLASDLASSLHCTPGGVSEEKLKQLAEIGVQACIAIETQGSKWLEEYKSREGEELVEWLLEEKKKAKAQELPPELCERATELKEFLVEFVDNRY